MILVAPVMALALVYPILRQLLAWLAEILRSATRTRSCAVRSGGRPLEQVGHLAHPPAPWQHCPPQRPPREVFESADPRATLETLEVSLEDRPGSSLLAGRPEQARQIAAY